MMLKVSLPTLGSDHQDQDRRWLIRLYQNGAASICRTDKVGNVLVEFGNLPAQALFSLKDLLNDVLSKVKPDFSDLKSMEVGHFSPL